MFKSFLVATALGATLTGSAYADCYSYGCDEPEQNMQQRETRDNAVGIGPYRDLDQWQDGRWGQITPRGRDTRDDQGVGLGPHRRLNSSDMTHWGQLK